MSEEKFTPGPWRIAEGKVHHDGHFVITATCMGTPSSPLATIGGAQWDETSRFDAALIAAAPDLYAALEAAIDCGMVPKSSAAEGGAMRHLRQVQVADMIRAALAKARGET